MGDGEQPIQITPALTGIGAERLAESGERVVITGAGGWAGLATLEMLRGLFGEALHRRVACFGAGERTLMLRGGVDVTQRPLSVLPMLRPRPSIVLHLAFLSQERLGDEPAMAYAAANRAISDDVRAGLDHIGARAVFFGSSGAVYQTDDPAAAEARRQYGAVKRLDEVRFARWATGAGAKAAIGRVFAISGPYISNWSGWALSSFIADVQAGRPIDIRADRKVYRSYVALEELMSVVIGALTDPGGGVVTFDTVGERTLEMNDLAAAVQEALGRDVGVRRPALRETPADRYVGNGDTYLGLLRKYAVRRTPIAEQIRQTADYMAGRADPLDSIGDHV